MADEKLLDRVHELIASTGWDEAKQKQFLSKHNAIAWEDCSAATLREVIEKLELFDGMFDDTCVDTNNVSGNDNGERDEVLRVYKDQ